MAVVYSKVDHAKQLRMGLSRRSMDFRSIAGFLKDLKPEESAV